MTKREKMAADHAQVTILKGQGLRGQDAYESDNDITLEYARLRMASFKAGIEAVMGMLKSEEAKEATHIGRDYASNWAAWLESQLNSEVTKL